MLSTISIIVKGKVQGVFFRQSTREKATELGLKGEVKNEADGSVAIIATGLEPQLTALIEWCKKGPPKAMVASVDTKPLPLQHFNSFIIIRN